MKKFLVMAVAAFVAVSAYAQTVEPTWSVDWSVFDMLDPEDGTSGIMNNYSIIWDLCWSASADKSDEIILGSRVFEAGLTSYTDYANADIYRSGILTFNEYMEPDRSGSCYIPVSGSTPSSSGYIWQRVVALSSNPDGTDYIWDGAAMQVNAITSILQVPTMIDGTGMELGYDEGYQWSIYSPTPVPEPATMSLLGLGALAMVLRRKLRK